MKKIFALLLALMLVLTAGCHSASPDETPESDGSAFKDLAEKFTDAAKPTPTAKPLPKPTSRSSSVPSLIWRMASVPWPTTL